MKKKSLVILGLVLTFLFIPQDTYASDYIIKSYNIDVVVNENNSLDIRENIGVLFNVYKHGIYRKIPLNNTVTRLDGTSSKVRAKVSNINVSDEYTAYTENGYKVIQIGNANVTVIGDKEYSISYNYNLGRDTGKDYDELYYNLIGPEWDTTINNITFKITMPKEFDESKIGFSSGEVGSIENDVDYYVAGNEIIGTYNGYLSSGEALTIRIELPEGYFDASSFYYDFSQIIMVGVPFICLIITSLIWFFFGKDYSVIETVEFYPPEGFNSLDIGFLYKGEADSNDVTSLLIYLANKGYIKIVELEEKALFSKVNTFKIVRLKEYDGNDANERAFLNGLFKNKRRKSSDDDFIVEVTADDLTNSFYKVMNKILLNVNCKENKNKIFSSNAKWKSFAVILFIILSFISIIGIPTLEYAGGDEVIMTLFITCFYIPFYAVGLFAKIPLGFRAFWLGFTIFHSTIFFSALPIAEALKNDMSYLICFIIGLICIVGMVIFFKLLPKRTAYGNEILGRIRGFKNFLEFAEKEKLEAMVMENPTYFYDILPYTYVLGVSDKWINKFETINMVSPDWYNSSTGFRVTSFGSFMGSTMKVAQYSMSSSPSSSSGGSGGSSGGGSSGGGSGGGGGGSW